MIYVVSPNIVLYKIMNFEGCEKFGVQMQREYGRKIKALQKTEALIHYISYLYIRYYLCAINIGVTLPSIFFIMYDAGESRLFKAQSTQHRTKL
jgi:hypothetical protein